MRGRKTDDLTLRAVQLLSTQMTPVEIISVLGLPKRTCYMLLSQIRKLEAQEEAERQRAQAEEVARLERERLDRLEWERKVFVSLAKEREQFSGRPGGGRFF